MTRETLAFLAGAAVCLAAAGTAVRAQAPASPATPRPPARQIASAKRPAIKPVASHAPDLNPVVKRYCAGCHSEKGKAGGLSLAAFDVTQAAQNPEIAEKVIRKLQAGFMPPRP